MSGGWEALNAAIAEAHALIGQEAPDAEIAAEGEAYISRVVAAGLGGALLGHLFRQGGLTRTLPVHGGPNPDYNMLHSGIDPAGRYRLDGRLNGSERVGVGLYTIGPNGAPQIAAYRAFDRSNCGEDGSFSLDIAADAQGAGSLSIPDGARVLLVRVLHRDDSDPSWLQLSGSPQRDSPSLAMVSNEQSLAFVAKGLCNNVREYLKWMAAAREMPNQLDTAPAQLTETVQGDADTQYFLGGFDLAEGEWLEVIMPAGLTGYWSLHAYSYWLEHLQTLGVHDRNAVPDADGRICISIGARVPEGASNIIDISGRKKGVLICRIVGQDGAVRRPETQIRRGA